MRDNYNIFLTASLVTTTLPLDETCHHGELPFATMGNYHLIYLMICLIDELTLDFVTAIWHGKEVDLNSHQLSP